MQNYNTDSLNTLPKGEGGAGCPVKLEDKIVPIELTAEEKLCRHRWLESLSDCV